MVKEHFPGRLVTDRQIATGIEHGWLKPVKVGNTRLFKRRDAERWIKKLRPSRTNPDRVRTKSHEELRSERGREQETT